MSGFWETGVRTVVGFAALLLLTRIVGNKQLGQMNIFTYITGIVIGNMAGEMILHKDVAMAEGIIGLVLWCFLAVAVEYVGLKSAAARVLLDGEPAIVIKKGKIIEEELKKRRLNMDDLSMLLRVNNTFSLLDVEYAILEPNGEFSVMKKPERESVTRRDMNVTPQGIQYIPSEIITDGKIVLKNLTELGKDEAWLAEELSRQGISGARNVLYAELQSDGGLYIQRKSGQ